MDNYTLSDLALASGNNSGILGGNGGGAAWLLIILLFFMMGGNGWNRTGELGQYATAASQQEILFGQQFQSLDNKIDRIGNGIADATYALNNSITGEGRAIQMQVAECCCGNKEATAQVRYDMANFAAQINANIDSKFAALEKAGLEQTISAQNARINQLELQSAMNGVVRYPNASTYYAGNNPFCGNGCGCA